MESLLGSRQLAPATAGTATATQRQTLISRLRFASSPVCFGTKCMCARGDCAQTPRWAGGLGAARWRASQDRRTSRDFELRPGLVIEVPSGGDDFLIDLHLVASVAVFATKPIAEGVIHHEGVLARLIRADTELIDLTVACPLFRSELLGEEHTACGVEDLPRGLHRITVRLHLDRDGGATFPGVDATFVHVVCQILHLDGVRGRLPQLTILRAVIVRLARLLVAANFVALARRPVDVYLLLPAGLQARVAEAGTVATFVHVVCQ